MKYITAFTAFTDRPPYINISKDEKVVRVAVRSVPKDGEVYGTYAEIDIPLPVWEEMKAQINAA